MSPLGDNALFRRLAIVAGCLAVTSATVYAAASTVGLQTAPDSIVMVCYLAGLAVALVLLLREKTPGENIRWALKMTGSLALFLCVWLGSIATGLSYGPDDCFSLFLIPGSVLGTALTVTSGTASLRDLFSRKFLRIFSRSILQVGVYWAAIAMIGSRMVAWLFNANTFERDLWHLHLPDKSIRSITASVKPLLESLKLSGEEEWFQIGLVLLSAMLTLLAWHREWHRLEPTTQVPPPESEPVSQPNFP